MLIGYARVSTDDQNLDRQLDYLKQAGCTTIYQEKYTGRSKERPELRKALARLKKDDTLVCLKLDRLGRSLKDLITLVDFIKSKGSHFKTSDGIDTSTHMGIFIFHIFGALAEMEVAMIRERTLSGLKAAKARGRIGGRPRGLSTYVVSKKEAVYTLYNAGKPIEEIEKSTNISRGTIYKLLKEVNTTCYRRKINESNN